MKKILLVAALAMMSAAAFAQQKFAYVNFTELVQLMPEADQARATIDASTKEASETYQAMADEFNTKYQQYQQKASTWTQAIRETKEKELTDIQQRIQEFNQTVQAELQQQQQQLMAPLYKKAQDTIEKLAKDGGCPVHRPCTGRRSYRRCPQGPRHTCRQDYGVAPERASGQS